MKELKQSETRIIKRSQINLNPINPKRHSDERVKLQKKNLQKVGFLGGIVWNEKSGNLIDGHRRIKAMDLHYKYDGTSSTDYNVKVEVVNLDEKTEKEQNVFMNNRNVQGEFDSDMLKNLLDGIDYNLAGLDDFDLNMLGIGDMDLNIGNDSIWRKEEILDDSLSAIDDLTKAGSESKNIDRSKNFYTDSKENQIARHNEIQKIKDRIGAQNSCEKDNGMLSYVVLSFASPTERGNFMEVFGYGFDERYIDGSDFMNRVEFGIGS